MGDVLVKGEAQWNNKLGFKTIIILDGYPPLHGGYQNAPKASKRKAYSGLARFIFLYDFA